MSDPPPPQKKKKKKVGAYFFPGKCFEGHNFIAQLKRTLYLYNSK